MRNVNLLGKSAEKLLGLTLLMLLSISFSAIAQQKVVGGVDVDIKEYPWQVALTSSPNGSGFCGGSIIGDSWVLTAAHCVNGDSPNSLYIRVGSSDPFAAGGDSYSVNQIIVHPNYSGNSHDFALVEIDGEFEFNSHVQSIDLVSTADIAAGVQDEGVMATITGWGTTSSGGSLSSTLQMVEAPIVNNSTACGSTTDVNGNSGDYGCSQLDESMICAGDLIDGGEDACQGDSGGPLVVRNAADTKWILIGATSWGYGCADVDYPGVWSKVSYVLDWIEDNADVNSDYGCTDASACNYDAEALYDDGSCAELDECGECGGNGPVDGYDCDGNCITGETLVVSMSDSYGDGWNGNNLIVNGVSLTIDSGSEGSAIVCYDSSAECVAVSCDGGAYQYEVSWTLSDADGNVLLSGGAPYEGGLGTCAIPVPGCTDATALNYNSEANEDDGSCVYPIDCEELTAVVIEIGGGSWGSEVSWTLGDLQGGTGSMEACLEDGCHIFNMYDSYGDGWNGNTLTIFAGSDVLLTGTLEEGSEGILSFGLNFEGECGPVYGCTDSLALNFNSEATSNDGSCTYPLLGCTDETALNYNAEATEDDGSCEYPIDCSDLMAVTIEVGGGFYDYEISWELNGLTGETGTTETCLEEGCYTFNMYDSYGDGWNSATVSITTADSMVLLTGTLEAGSEGVLFFSYNEDCGYTYGCTDSLALNYDSEATFDDGSCVYPLPGCTDEIALNYNPEATEDDGSCIYPIDCSEATAYTLMMYDSYGDGWNGNTFIVNSEDQEVNSLTLVEGESGVEDFCLNDGCYSIYVGGGSWSSEVSWELVTENGDVVLTGGAPSEYPFSVNTDCGYTYGCTDSLALNFDAEAMYDDGSCMYPIYGCTDSVATNFNELATEDDGSCEYPIDCADLTVVSISVDGGSYPSEVSWDIAGFNGVVGTSEACLADGCHTFNMHDSYGDGWNGNTVTITSSNGEILLSGTLDSGYEGSLGFGLNTTEDCGEITIDILGCTDSLAINYNEYATQDDGSCEYESTCDMYTVMMNMMDSYGDGWNGSEYVISSDGEMVASGTFNTGSFATDEICLSEGCYTISVSDGSYPSEVSWSLALLSDDIMEIIAEGTTGDVNFGVNTSEDCGEITLDILGCTDSLAINYNELATQDDGSCEYAIDCADLTSVIIEVGGGQWASEVSWEIAGFTGVVGTSEACLADGCHTFNMIDSYGDGWNGNTVTITSLDGEVLLTGTLDSGYEGSLGFGLNTTEDCGEITLDILGCTDSLALNYNELATQDDGSCEYASDCDGLTTVTIEVGGGDYANEVSWDVSGFNGEVGVSEVCLADGCHIFNMHDSYGDGWNGNTVTITTSNGDVLLNGTLEEGFEAALGFGLNTSEDCGDGEIIIDVLGCMDSSAINYNPLATQDDGSCEYEESNLPDWIVTITGSNHTMILDGNAAIDMDGANIEVGDALGVFYTNANGDLTCAGYAIWTGSTNTIAIQGDDSTTEEIDGFVAGEEFVWVIWDASEDTEYMATATYSSAQISQGEFVVNGISALTALTSVPAVAEQVISMPEGWSMFSTYMLADNMDMAAILNPIFDDVIIAKNNTGSAYLPEWGFNGIGDLQVGQAYQVKLANANEITIEGTYMAPEENPIQLTAGWNMIGYLRLEPAPADAVLEAVNASGNLIIAKDYNGSAYLPAWGFNGIGDMVPGEGYQLKVTNDDVVQYLANDISYRLTSTQIIENDLSYFAKASITDNNMIVVIDDMAWDMVPNEGSEVAAYDKSGNLIGAAIYSSPVTVITLWGDDATTSEKDGLTTSEVASFKVYNEGSVREISITEWVEGSSAYSIDAINIAAAITSNVDFVESSGTERVLIKVVNTLGQEVQLNDQSFKGEVLFKVFSDGTVEKIVQ